MDKHDFATTEPAAWWLIDPNPDHRIVESRLALGAANGWHDQTWFTEQPKLEILYDAIQLHSPNLLTELDLLTDDEQRLKWLADVETALAPAPAGPSTTEDSQTEQASGPDAQPAPPAAPAPAKKSIFAKKAAPEASEQPAPPSPELASAVKETLEALAQGDTAELAADLGLTEDEVASLIGDPEFERMVHEEAALLHAGQAEG